MAIEKTINVKVNTGNSEQELQQLEQGFKDVDKAAEKTSKSVDDVAGNGGAIAILDQLTGGLATRLRDAYEASKLFNTSLKATRGALIATGIGAFVVALGLIVAYWDDIVEFIGGANRKLEKQHTLLETNISILTSEITLNEKRLKLAEDGSKEAENLLKIQKDLLLEKQKLLDEDIKLLEAQLLKETSLAAELSLWDQILLATGNVAANIIDEEETKRLKELRLQINALKGEALDVRAAISGDDKDSKSGKRDRVKGVSELTTTGTTEQQQEQRDKDAEFFEETFKLEQFREEQLTNLKIDEDLKRSVAAAEESQKRIDIAKREADNKILFDENVAQAKSDLALNTFNLLTNLAEEGSNLAKGLAIANVVREQVRAVSGIISSTAEANAKAAALSPLTLGQPFVTLNTISAGLGIAGSVAGAVKSIKDITSEKKSPSGGNVSGGGGGGTPAPAFNLVEGTGTNQVAQSIQDQEPVKAFVVSSDMTSSQELDRNIKENASI